MNLVNFFKSVVEKLQNRGVDYALAGGLMASVYRENERATNDLDFLIVAGDNTRAVASSLIEQFGLVPHVIRKADLEGGPLFARKMGKTTPYIIAGRAEKGEHRLGLDFILPEMPWSKKAMERAKYNRIDFGFGPIPCLTKEDIIISKLYSLRNDSTRFNDLDDLKSIFQSGHEIDLIYTCGRMQELKLLVPDVLKDIAPKPMLHISKRIRKGLRKRR